MSSSLLSDSKMLDAVASILVRQHQINNSKDKVSDFEHVHALATANLLASTQLDIAKQLEEEEVANADLERAKSKAKQFSKSSEVRKVNTSKKRKHEEAATGAEKLNKTGQHLVQGPRSSSAVPLLDVKSAEPKVLVCSFDGCGRKFAWTNHLKYHELTHTNNRQFKCTKQGCEKTFFTAQRLNVHLRTHTGQKPFKCDVKDCGKTFTTAGNLKNHCRLHTGERPYACEEAGCNQRFAERSSLTKHKLTHSGDKPFSCELCGKKFTQSSSRRQHMLRHSLNVEITASLVKQTGGTATAVPHNTHVTGPSDEGCDGVKGHMRCKVPEKKSASGVGQVDSSHATVVKAVSCSPQVLVLSNSYPGLPTSEPVVFSSGLGEHIVTVSSQSVQDQQNLSFPQTMLHSDHGFTSDNLEHKPENLVILAENTIYGSASQGADIVYASDILDQEKITPAQFRTSHDLDYQGEMTSAKYTQTSDPEVYVHHGLSHPESFTVVNECRELTITEYIKSGPHSYPVDTEKLSCGDPMASFQQSTYSTEETSQLYGLGNNKDSCEGKTHFQLEAEEKHLEEYSQPDSHHVYYLDPDMPACDDDFVGAEVVAIAQHSVEEVDSDQIQHAGVEFSGNGMDPMMECDEVT